MKYKVGDRVRIKSIDWYYDNRDRIDEVTCGYTNFIPDMVKYCGEIVTISSVLPILEVYHIEEDVGMFNWTDEMIEGLVEEETKNWADINIPDGPYTVTYGSPSMNDSMNKNNIDNGIIILPEGYIFKDENGNVINATKIVLEKKKKEYPKTYEECCKVLGIDVRDLDILDNMLDTSEIVYRKNLDRLLNSHRKLLICRDAYWKIAGEEMGLRKPWKPTDSDYTIGKYCILVFRGNIIYSTPAQDCSLTFPTEEMRDAFYENFKELIEQCKELL